MTEHQRSLGVFSSIEDATSALGKLRDSGFDMEKVSVVARDATHGESIAGADLSNSIADTRNPVDTKAGEVAAAGAIAGGSLGGVAGLLVGLAALTIPGVGPIVVGGTLGSTLAGSALGAAAGGLRGAFMGSRVPDDSAKAYTEALSNGSYLVLVDGTPEELGRAQEILSPAGIQHWATFDVPNTAEVSSDQLA